MKYRPEIDGLRAIAVVAVILYHAGFKIVGGGFIGVDVFFVISGYLISTIIIADLNKGIFSVPAFYERRARRILPALYAVMLCCLPFAWLWLPPHDLDSFSKSLVAVPTFLSNVLFYRESGYFAPDSALKPLLHTWSLAVEERYYMLFPVFLLALWQFRKRWLLATLACLTILSLGAAQWGAHNKPAAAFFLLPSRVWELAIGAIVAFFFSYRRDQVERLRSHTVACEILGAVGIGLIGYSICAFNDSTPFPSLFALVPTIGTALVIVVSTSRTVVGRMLSTKPVVGMGLISYSAYLWHQPLFAFARHRSLFEPSAATFGVLSVASLVLAYCSWRFIERPFRNKRITNPRRVFGYSTAGAVFFVAIGCAGHYTHGFENRMSGEASALAGTAEIAMANYGLDQSCDAVEFTLSPKCRTSNSPEIVVWGDSYAMQLVQGILSSHPGAEMIQLTKSVCGPFFGVAPVTAQHPIGWARACVAFNKHVHDWLDSNKTVKFAVLSSPITPYLSGKLLVDGRLYNGSPVLATDRFVATLKELKRMGITPVVFSPTPQTGANIGQCLARANFLHEDTKRCDFLQTEATANAEAYEFLRNISQRYHVVFLDEDICLNGTCKASIGTTPVYRDAGHLTRSGSALIGKNNDFYSDVIEAR